MGSLLVGESCCFVFLWALSGPPKGTASAVLESAIQWAKGCQQGNGVVVVVASIGNKARREEEERLVVRPEDWVVALV